MNFAPCLISGSPYNRADSLAIWDEGLQTSQAGYICESVCSSHFSFLRHKEPVSPVSVIGEQHWGIIKQKTMHLHTFSAFSTDVITPVIDILDTIAEDYFYETLKNVKLNQEIALSHSFPVKCGPYPTQFSDNHE
ncbi:hypothetical protein ACTXT7_003554 [Hymenolepis weldensis]